MMTDEAKLLEKARAFARDVMQPASPWRELDGSLKAEVFKKAAEIGLTGVQVPREHGGLGLPFSAKSRLAAQLAEADFGLAMAIINTQNAAFRIARESLVAKTYVPELLSGSRVGCTALTEWTAGSDFAAIKMVARREGEGWRLNGEKAWITNAIRADTFIVFAQTGEAGLATSIASFLVDGRRRGFVRGALLGNANQASAGSGSFRLDDYEVKPDEVLAQPGHAFKSVLTEINGARIYVAAMCCGMLKAAINEVAEFGQVRRTFGRSLHNHQGWRWVLAEAAADLAAGEALVAEAAAALDRAEDVQLVAAKVKVMATRMVERHLPALVHAMGAEGLRSDRTIGRHLAAVPLVSLVDGSTEILLERIAKLQQEQGRPTSHGEK